LAGAVTTRLLLRLPDRSDHTLAGIPLAAVPRELPPGRALIAPDGIEVQLAHAGSQPTRASAAEHAHACAARWRQAPTAMRLRPLPLVIDLADLPAPGDVAPFAVAAPYGRPIGVPLAQAARLLVAGPARSGRTATLTSLLHQAVRTGQPVNVLASARSALSSAASSLGVHTLRPDDDPSVLDGVHGVLLVDDSERLSDTALDDALVGWARHAAPCALVVAARTEDVARAYRGITAEVRRSRCALLLQPGPLDAELIGTRLGPGSLGGPPGRGVLLGDPAWGNDCAAGPVRVQVARAA
jgi:S-DNA-T family DNA segregation ATPase FtsK/SpoIIIE